MWASSDAIRNAWGLRRGRNVHSPAVTAKTSPSTYTLISPARTWINSSHEWAWGGGSVPRPILLTAKSNAPLLSAVPAIWLTSMPLYHVELVNAGDLL